MSATVHLTGELDPRESWKAERCTIAKALEAEQKPNQLLRNSVTEVEIAEIVSKWTGIPVSRMLEGERDGLGLADRWGGAHRARAMATPAHTMNSTRLGEAETERLTG